MSVYNSTCRSPSKQVEMEQNLSQCLPPCIDLTILPWYDTYSRFSYWVNGVLTVGLVCLGCIGNSVMVWSIRHNRRQKRLCWHLRMLCFWDTLLLLSILGFTGLPCIFQQVVTLYGSTGYLLQFLHPLGSIATTASVWEILAITGERYWAVTHPLKPFGNGGTSIKCICSGIGVGAFLINILSLFESDMIHCYHWKHHKVYPQLAKNFLSDSNVYLWICRLVPDFIFRCPLPFVLIIMLTARTLIGRRKRHVTRSSESFRHMTETRGLSTPVILTILNTKFIICNSLFVTCNLLKMAGWDNLKTYFFMADISNFLVSVQSATNWLLFLQWKRPITNLDFKTRKDSVQIFSKHELERLKVMWQHLAPKNKDKLTLNLVGIFLEQNPELLELIKEANVNSNGYTSLSSTSIDPDIVHVSNKVRDFLDDIITKLTTIPFEILAARRNLREIGQNLSEKGIRINSDCWATAKAYIVDCFNVTKIGARSWPDEMVASKFCSFIIREIKHGSFVQKFDNL